MDGQIITWVFKDNTNKEQKAYIFSGRMPWKNKNTVDTKSSFEIAVIIADPEAMNV